MQLHALVLDAGVPVLQLLVELEPVLQPRAAAALHEHAQHQLRIALALESGRATFLAAASVNRSAGASCSASVVLISPLAVQSRRPS